jgi:serine/threonine-protein kinase
MAAKDGIVRVIDFGLALSSVREARTEQGIVLGKLAYMSPEQARGEAVDAAADVYAAGVVLYELLTGERYWGTLSSSEIWSRIGFGTHVPGQLAAADQLSGGVLSFMTAVDKRDRIGAVQARDLLLTMLRASGGADAARRRLAVLVQVLAAPELARMDQARLQARSQAPTLHDMPRTTISLALSEVQAVEALLRTLPPSVLLEPVTTTTLPRKPDQRGVGRADLEPPRAATVGGEAEGRLAHLEFALSRHQPLARRRPAAHPAFEVAPADERERRADARREPARFILSQCQHHARRASPQHARAGTLALDLEQAGLHHAVEVCPLHCG